MGGRSSGSGFNRLERSIAREENAIRNNPTETVVIFDRDGNVLLRYGEGKETSVNLTREQAELLRGNVMTHNHPHGYYLSREDVATMLSWGAREIRATTPDGRAFSLTRTEPLDLKGKHGAFYEEYQRAMNSLAYTAYENTRNITRTTGRTTTDHDTAIEHTRLVNDWLSRNAKTYGMEFKVIGEKTQKQPSRSQVEANLRKRGLL